MRLTEDEEQKKWHTVHGTLKTMIYTGFGGMLSSAEYIMRYSDIHVITKKNDIDSLVLRRLWSVWDIAFERWVAELQLGEYKSRDIYKLFVRARNVAFTIIDNDGAYVKLLYHFLSVWEEIKDNDKYNEDEPE